MSLGALRIRPYPWQALDRVSQTALRSLRAARDTLDIDTVSLAASIGEILCGEAQLVLRRLAAGDPDRTPAIRLCFELDAPGCTLDLWLQPQLASIALARLLARPIAWGSDQPLPPNLAGALAAIGVEAARRAGILLRARDSETKPDAPADLSLRASLLLDGDPYDLALAVYLTEKPTALPPRTPKALGELGPLPLALPLIVGAAVVRPNDLRGLGPGDAWLPGCDWRSATGTRQLMLAPPGESSGWWVDWPGDGSVVVSNRGSTLTAAHAQGLAMDSIDDNSAPAAPSSLEEVLQASPVVARVELASVSLSAQEWARLRPGDVLQTGRRLSEPAVLRVAGRIMAEGELVDIEGELGLVIKRLITKDSE